MNANAFYVDDAFDVFRNVFMVWWLLIYVAIIWREKGWLKFFYGILLSYAAAMYIPMIVVGSALIAASKAFANEFMIKVHWVRNGMR